MMFPHSLPTGDCMRTNTLTIAELEAKMQETVAAFGGQMHSGIQDGHVNHEDSYPWFELGEGKINRHNADAFMQALADALNCKVFMAHCSASGIVGAIDFDESALDSNGAPQAFPADEDIYGYGELFTPRATA